VEPYALPVQVYGAGLIFARVGALAMLIPGLGEQSVPPRIRLAFAFLFTLVLYPVERATLPGVPASLGELVGQIIIEILIGLAIGSLMRLFLGSLAVAGEVVSLQTTLSFAQTTNPLGAAPTTTVATFLTLLGLTMIFATDLHHLFIGAVARSYVLFPAGKGAPVGDFGALMVRTFGQTFVLGLQLAAPVVVFSLVFNVAAGFIGRVMPQFQVFFVATPLTVLLGLSVFALSLGVFGLVWVDGFRAFLDRFVGAT
jgi:flagellar biosynthetic protein FliR